MEISIFTDKSIEPGENDLRETLGDLYHLWDEIKNFVLGLYPSAVMEWNYPGKKYGWSYRLKDKKRAIIYLLPRDKYFKVAFVFGQKTTNEIMGSEISDDIKTELANARVYAEGRGIRIEIKDTRVLDDVKKLVVMKLKY